MSHENVDVVRQWWEAWDADDLGRGLALMDDGLVTRRLAPMPDPGTWDGTEGLLDVAAEWVDTFDEFAMAADDFIDAGDHVVVRVQQQGRGTDSRVPVTDGGGQMAVAWVMANPVITSAIIGASRPDQLDDSLKAAATPMPEDLKQRLDELTAPYRRGDDPR